MTQKALTIDGSFGEGGGQILRTSLALSMVTGKPFCIENIRAGRKKPGLMRQHLSAVNAAAQVSGGHVEGNRLGSLSLTFKPGPVQPGDYHFSVGSAGSGTLVLQTVLPALLNTKAPSSLVLEGGTHNPYAPPFDFLEKCYFRQIEKMGPQISARLHAPGFYPAGNGRFTVKIKPVDHLLQIDIINRGAILKQYARAMVSNLPVSIAERELRVIKNELNWDRSCLKTIQIQNAKGPGNILFAEIASEQIIELFTGFGRRGVRAETVAQEVVTQVVDYLQSDAPVDKYLADQLLIPMSLAGGGRFRTLSPSKHTLTNIEVIQKFLPVTITVEKHKPGLFEIIIYK